MIFDYIQKKNNYRQITEVNWTRLIRHIIYNIRQYYYLYLIKFSYDFTVTTFGFRCADVTFVGLSVEGCFFLSSSRMFCLGFGFDKGTLLLVNDVCLKFIHDKIRKKYIKVNLLIQIHIDR